MFFLSKPQFGDDSKIWQTFFQMGWNHQLGMGLAKFWSLPPVRYLLPVAGDSTEERTSVFCHPKSVYGGTSDFAAFEAQHWLQDQEKHKAKECCLSMFE